MAFMDWLLASAGQSVSVCHPSLCSVSCTVGSSQSLSAPVQLISNEESVSRSLVREKRSEKLLPYRDIIHEASVLPVDDCTDKFLQHVELDMKGSSEVFIICFI